MEQILFPSAWAQKQTKDSSGSIIYSIYDRKLQKVVSSSTLLSFPLSILQTFIPASLKEGSSAMFSHNLQHDVEGLSAFSD